MALTRRTARFGEIAGAVDNRLQTLGIKADASYVDEILRQRIDTVAELMGVTPRTALNYAPADLPELIVGTIVDALQS